MYQPLYNRILDVLAGEGPLSAADVTQRLQYKRSAAVANAFNSLLIRGQVQRVRTSDCFRLSPTQAALHAGQL